MRPRTEECIIITIDSGLETPFKILADGLDSGRDRTGGGRRVRQTHWIVTRPSEVSGGKKGPQERRFPSRCAIGRWTCGEATIRRFGGTGMEAGSILVSGNKA